MSNQVSTSKRPLRILVTPLNGHGHINACHGLCEELRDRGHEVIFLIDSDFKGRLERHGFQERLLPAPEKLTTDDGKEFWQSFLEKNTELFGQSPSEQMTNLIPIIFRTMFDMQNTTVEAYDEAIRQLKPDLIIHDGYICFPTVVNQSVPWVWLFSASPQALLMDGRVPPFYSGLPLSDQSEWQKFADNSTKVLSELQHEVSDYNVANGGEPIVRPRMHPLSKHLNLYMSPKELRFEELTDLPANIVGVDCFVRTIPDLQFAMPEQLRNKAGKLVFFSMGSFGCANLPLMTRLVAMLAKSPHRFIVSKGPLKYDLPGNNLWGEPFLPQTAILPLVDLVITHGGNNTVTETFFYGKPMLVMPMFADQHDNAQRIAEVGLGAKLNPFLCTEQELLYTIESLLANEELSQKMNQIKQRIRTSNDKQKVADLIENLVQ